MLSPGNPYLTDHRMLQITGYLVSQTTPLDIITLNTPVFRSPLCPLVTCTPLLRYFSPYHKGTTRYKTITSKLRAYVYWWGENRQIQWLFKGPVSIYTLRYSLELLIGLIEGPSIHTFSTLWYLCANSTFPGQYLCSCGHVVITLVTRTVCQQHFKPRWWSTALLYHSGF